MGCKPLEEVRAELLELIEIAGGDRNVALMLGPICSGHGPDRSTIGRMRRGEGRPALLAMTTTLLRRALEATEYD